MKNMFNSLFGVDPDQIKETCVLVPFVTKEIVNEFKIKKLSKGVVYATANNDHFSLVYTKMGSTFLGDAVLHLEKTKCKNIILFGSCCVAKNNSKLKIGDLVVVKESIVQDSFVNVLENKDPINKYYSDRKLLKYLDSIHNVLCLSVGSIKLEQRYLKFINDDLVDVIDLETGALYAAAKKIGKKALSILYITDSIDKNPYYEMFKDKNVLKLKQITKKSANRCYDIVKHYFST